MSINLVALSVNFSGQKEIGVIESDFFQDLRSIRDHDIQLLKYISPYEKTFFNKKQIAQLKREVLKLKISGYNQEYVKILLAAIEDVALDAHCSYLVLIGD